MIPDIILSMTISSNINSVYWDQSYCPDNFPHCDDHQNSDYLDCDLISCYSGHWSLVLSHHILKQNRFITHEQFVIFVSLSFKYMCLFPVCLIICASFYLFVWLSYCLHSVRSFCVFVICLLFFFCLCDSTCNSSSISCKWEPRSAFSRPNLKVLLLSTQPTTTHNNNNNYNMNNNNNNNNRNINNGYTWRSFRPALTYFCSRPQVEPGNTINYTDKAPTILAMEF